MGNTSQFVVFLLAGYVVFPIVLFLFSWLWYRLCSDSHLAMARQFSPYGMIVGPLVFLVFALLTDPRSLFPIIAPTWVLVMCIASYLGLLRAWSGRQKH